MKTKPALFVIILRYIVPIEKIEEHLKPHREFLDKYIAKKILFATGAQTPRNGGVLLAKAASREEVMKIIEEDSFKQHNCAEYQIFQFTPTKFAPELADFFSDVI